MIVDANLNSLKSDLCVKRSVDYSVDLSQENPQAVLWVTYEHTCRTRDWMTTDYNDWARVYAPAGSWLVESSLPQEKIRFSDELGRKVFGFPIYVPIGKTETAMLKYNLPASFKNSAYQLLIQKQSGSGEMAVEIKVKKADGSESLKKEILTGDREFNL